MLELFGPLTPGLLLLMIISLVNFLKELGISGKWSLAAAIAMGLVFGVLFQLGIDNPVLGKWFQIIAYGLTLGLAASGLFDLSKIRKQE